MFQQANAEPDWSNSSQPAPSTNFDGTNGEHGVNGFSGTSLNIDTEILDGETGYLSFEIYSGSGSDGQHGSDGLTGEDGVNAADSTYFVWNGKRENVCGTFDSCENCCGTSATVRWEISGKDCTTKGTNGGNGGNGGNSGSPGTPGNFTMYSRKGNKQNIKYMTGNSGVPGRGGKGKLGGSTGKGGCGERTSCSTTGNGHGWSTSCRSYTECSEKFKGQDCPSNSNGVDGKSGVNPPFFHESGRTLEVFDSRHTVDISINVLNYLLEYAKTLKNNHVKNEARDILKFISRYDNSVARSARRLLSQMGSMK